ncbi:MAG TPA: hypothetical protein VE548_11235 [Nitrososphaeraceae archaeon]|nr:hypothetical protein [Nitrososphaeraceae archaeon]
MLFLFITPKYCVDDQTPQFSFVIIEGIAKVFRYRQNELLKWATRIAERYMGKG